MKAPKFLTQKLLRILLWIHDVILATRRSASLERRGGCIYLESHWMSHLVALEWMALQGLQFTPQTLLLVPDGMADRLSWNLTGCYTWWPRCGWPCKVYSSRHASVPRVGWNGSPAASLPFWSKAMLGAGRFDQLFGP